MKSLDTVIESFKLVYKNPKIMLIPLAISALSFIFIFITGLFFGVGIDDIFRGIKNAKYFSSPPLIIILLFSLLIYPILVGMLISSGIQALKGKLNLSRAFNEAKKKYLSLLGVFLISTIIEIVLLFVLLIFRFVLLIFGVFGLIISERLLDILAFFYLIVAIIFYLISEICITVLLFEANTVVFTENRKAFDAVKRSFHIGKEKLLSIIATNVFFFILVFGTMLILVIPIFLTGSIMFIIFVILFIGFILPVKEILPVVFYYNYNLKNLK